MEIWKTIENYPNYEISNFGNVKRKQGYQCKIERILIPLNNGNDYMNVGLSKDGIKKREYVHRLVAEAFLGTPKIKLEVNHIDGNKLNNQLSNLEWVTRSENQNHRYKVLKHKGANTGKLGELNWKSKKVAKMDLQGNVICVYPAVMEAMRITNICESNIRGCIYGRSKTAGGFKWKYI
jgi:hypothetical protein